MRTACVCCVFQTSTSANAMYAGGYMGTLPSPPSLCSFKISLLYRYRTPCLQVRTDIRAPCPVSRWDFYCIMHQMLSQAKRRAENKERQTNRTTAKL